MLVRDLWFLWPVRIDARLKLKTDDGLQELGCDKQAILFFDMSYA